MKVDCIILNVPHNEFVNMDFDDINLLLNPNSVFIDVKGIFSHIKFDKSDIHYFRL